jgi:hypothetical protein
MWRLAMIGVTAFFAVSFSSCQEQPTIILNPDLTTEVTGVYEGNYEVNYATRPQDNFVAQVEMIVSRVDNKVIAIDAQGGDSFECSINGSTSFLTFSNLQNQKGAFSIATKIEGQYNNGRLYYKLTGQTQDGGDFYAEFSVL